MSPRYKNINNLCLIPASSRNTQVLLLTATCVSSQERSGDHSCAFVRRGGLLGLIELEGSLVLFLGQFSNFLLRTAFNMVQITKTDCVSLICQRIYFLEVTLTFLLDSLYHLYV